MSHQPEPFSFIQSHCVFREYHQHGVANIIGVNENLAIVYANHISLLFCSFSEEDVIGKPRNNYCGTDDDSKLILERIQEKQPLRNLEFTFICQGETQKKVLVSSQISIDETNEVTTYLFITDITSYKKNEELLSYLNIATEELAQARDTRSALNKISKLIVPKFANWFTIDILNNGNLNLLVLAHEDPETIQWALSYREKYPVNLNSNEGAAVAVRTGKPSFVPVITDEMLVAGIPDPEKLDIVRKLNMQSIITVAMYNRDVISGIITFISTMPGKNYDEADLRFAQNFANHIGLALENTRLNEEASAEISRRKIIEEELKKSEELFRLMAETMPQKVFSTDAKSNLTYINPQWAQFTGYSLEEIEKVSLAHFIHPDDLENNLKMWDKALKSGQPFLYEHRFRNKEGEYLWHLTRALALKDYEGNITQWIGTMTDINDQKVKEEKKDEFISIASHELRTPLTTVKAFFQLAKKNISAGDKAFIFIDKAGRQLERLEKLISNLLDVTKINAGKLVYDIEEFNFHQLLTDAVENVQHTLATHTIVIQHSTHVVLKGDKLKIEEVINNLLTNAIKYSPDADKVIIRSEIVNNDLQVSVQDFGIGIAPESINGLFERFHRVDSNAMRFQGLGLGLFISSEIIKGHGGRYWVKSELGQGSTFYFTLPIK